MNPNEILKLAKDALEKSLSEKRMNAELLRSIGPAIVESLAPALERVANSNKFNHDVSIEEQRRMNKEFMGLVGPAVISAVMPAIEKIAKSSEDNAKAIKEALSNVTITVTPEFKTPEVKIPPIVIPEIKLPTIVVPKITVPTPQVNFDLSQIKIPDIHMPDNMAVKGWVGFMGYDRKMLNDPLPVQLRDADGNPIKLFENLTSLMTQSVGGGGFPMRVVDESTNSLRVSGSFSISASNSSSQAIDSSGNVYNVANPFPVQVVSGAASSTKAQIGNSDGDYSAANPLPVTFSPSGSQNVNVFDGQASSVTSHQFNTDFRALDVYIGGSFQTTVADLQSGDNRLKVDGSAVTQPVSGTVAATKSGTWTIDNPVDNGDAATALRVVVAGNSAVSVSATQIGTWNIGTVTTVTGVTNSIAAALTDSSGVQYSGSNPVPVGIQSAINQGDAATALRVVIAGNSDASVSATQVGTWNIGTVTTVTGVTNTVNVRLDTPDGIVSAANPLPITGSLSLTADYGSGEIGTNTLRTVQATNAVSSVDVQFMAGTATAVGSGVTNAGTLRVVQAVDSVSSTSVGGAFTAADAATPNAWQFGIGTQGYAAIIPYAFNGTNYDRLRNSSGEGGGLRIQQATDSVSSVNVTNASLTVTVSGSVSSVVATGPTLHDAVDDGDAPLKIGGVAIQTVPTAVADGDRVRFIGDDLGRQLVRHTARDLMATAYVQLTNGTETTLIAGVASTFLDLVYVMGANNSDAAVSIDFRSGTAGSVIKTIEIPAYGTSGVAPGQPIPMAEVAQAWTADMPDITGTTISLTALFNKEK